jgi:3-deoxy-manno-octulosonate cytidylyltransferase (CMP-KDO synthetase)
VAAHLDCDLVVNIQGDEPLIEPSDIDAAIEPFRDDAALR